MAEKNYEELDAKAQKRALAEEYDRLLRKRDEQLRKKLSHAQYYFFKNHFYLDPSERDDRIFNELLRAMRRPETVPSEFVTGKLDWLFDDAIPPKERDVILYFADRLREYPYSDSYYRRSFRVSTYRAYGSKLVDLIRCYASNATIRDVPLDLLLTRQGPETVQAYLDTASWMGNGYHGWQVAYALDHHDAKVEEAVTRILTEENGSGLMTTALIRGIVCSHRKEFHELLGKLLLAARLQEGLRQSICENADCGTKDAFLTLLKVIADNRLIRFSSVKRAVGTWLGIVSDDTRDLDRISEKSVRLIVECLESEERRIECLASEDAMEIYTALWSYGFDDIIVAIQKMEKIVTEGTHHQLLVAGYFAANLDQPAAANQIAKLVIRLHYEKEDVLAVWLPSFMSQTSRISELWNFAKQQKPLDLHLWFDSREELDEQYQIIERAYHAFSGKTKTFSPCVFPWYEAKLTRSDFAEVLCTLAALSGDSRQIDKTCPLVKECDADQRHFYFGALLNAPKTAIQRRTVIEGLMDRSSSTRKDAYKIAKGIKLSTDEYQMMEDYLRLKGADVRKQVMDLLLRQDDSALEATLSRLLDSGKEDVRLGALDMLTRLQKDGKRSALADSFLPRLVKRAQCDDLPAKEKILLDALVPDAQSAKPEEPVLFTAADHYSPTEFDEAYVERCAATFAEYFPDSHLPDLIRGKDPSLLGKLKDALSVPKQCQTAALAAEDLRSLERFFEDHKHVSYEWSGETILLGNAHGSDFWEKNGVLPLADLWAEWRQTNGVTPQRALCARTLYSAFRKSHPMGDACADFIRTVYGAGFERADHLPYNILIDRVFESICRAIPDEHYNLMASALTIWFIRCVPDDQVMVPGTVRKNLPPRIAMAHLLAHPQFVKLYKRLACKNDADLKYVFPLAVASAERCRVAYKKLPYVEESNDYGMFYSSANSDYRSYLQSPQDAGYMDHAPLVGSNDYLRAAYQGILTQAQLYEFLLKPEVLNEALAITSSVAASLNEQGKTVSTRSNYHQYQTTNRVKTLLGKQKEPDEEDLKLLRFVAKINDILIPMVVTPELARGDSPTPYSKAVLGIARIYGADYLAKILSAMGKDTIDRSAYHGWGDGSDRKLTLSYLLSVCIPGEDDSATTLRAALEGKKITPKRLIEAALFSPEWIPVIGDYLGIDSFEAVCYYFMAHMNEQFDDKRKAMIAKYTPLSEEELNQGAFDVNWFRSAYEQIGEREFDLIYDAAKYTADGAKHARARKYADAVLGKFNLSELEAMVSDKRNKDLLMAYALVPLEGEDDLCHRYLYIQRFGKESKQFGSQRIASEGKAVEMALKNLATNAGYADTMRLTLRMETKVIDDSRDLLEEQMIEGVAFQIQLDDNGKAALTCRKDGKPLKSVPAKLKKHESVLALTTLVKTLTEQYRRTRVMLERAMEDGTVFTFGELWVLSSHPVVYPMLKNLVLISGDLSGFLAPDGLSDAEGTLHPIASDAEVKIAHPFDLYQIGAWRGYQQYLFEQQIAQPFRQVFRELYIKTAEELEALHSLRYAGNQIQPAKTVATLKSRRWVADVEDGLQKVYYKENIVAQIYALADWFSPADIEAPTLEWVCFSHRKTGEAIKIADVPDVVFSEVMRDVDLAVSVAHAGGVDPETSHSTMEMRAAILSFVLPMFRLDNVKIEERHAIIQGKLAEYSVHLGSGIVHQIGGAMIPVLPVHSQHRGKVFLPFVDDDPKTAEIISKVLLFAEDGKIKDPMILSAISR